MVVVLSSIIHTEHICSWTQDHISFDNFSLQMNSINEKVKDINKYVKEIENYIQQGKEDYKKVI